MEQKYYCPKCSEELEKLSGCGAVGYFCNRCRGLVSRSKMLNREEMEKNSCGKVENNPPEKIVD